MLPEPALVRTSFVALVNNHFMTHKQRDKVKILLKLYGEKLDPSSRDDILDIIVEDFYRACEQDEVCMPPRIVKQLIELAFEQGIFYAQNQTKDLT